jgi:hypothetical protein
MSVMVISMTTRIRQARNTALLIAELERQRAVRDAEIEYSETVAKLRERFEADLAEAADIRLARVAPAQRAYNSAVIAAERTEGATR